MHTRMGFTTGCGFTAGGSALTLRTLGETAVRDKSLGGDDSILTSILFKTETEHLLHLCPWQYCHRLPIDHGCHRHVLRHRCNTCSPVRSTALRLCAYRCI